MQHHKLLTSSLLALSLGACVEDSATMTMPDPKPVAPRTVPTSGVQATKTNGRQAHDVTFTAGKNRNVSFASMFGESNDWFFVPHPVWAALPSILHRATR